MPGIGMPRRSTARTRLYENLVMELKNSIVERDAGLAEARTALSTTQATLAAVQRATHHEMDSYGQEVRALRASLTLALKDRNEFIEARQGEVRSILKKMKTLKLQPQNQNAGEETTPPAFVRETESSSHETTASILKPEVNDATEKDEDLSLEKDEDLSLEPTDSAEDDDAKRAEDVAKRYAAAVERVKLENTAQQKLLAEMETAIQQEQEQKKRTNAVTLGSVTVTMAAHPRDLFKALTIAHNEILNLRRASQRSAALQTDRLLTLTTHLAHLSEELWMVRKRTKAEIDFWKLECEKQQNASNTMAADLQRVQRELERSSERISDASAEANCPLCRKHQTRAQEMSRRLPKCVPDDRSTSVSSTSPFKPCINGSDIAAKTHHTEHRPGSAQPVLPRKLNETERKNLCSVLMDLEDFFSTLTNAQQDEAEQLIAMMLFNVPPAAGGPMQLPLIHFREHEFGANVINMTGSCRETQLSPTNATNFQSTSVLNDRGFGTGGIYEDNQVEKMQPMLGGRALIAKTSRDIGDATSLVVCGNKFSAFDSPSHVHKKVVRTILSQEEMLDRQRIRVARIQGLGSANQSPAATIDVDKTIDKYAGFSIGQHLPDEHHDEEYGSFVDEKGEEVYFVDIEVNDDKTKKVISENENSAQKASTKKFVPINATTQTEDRQNSVRSIPRKSEHFIPGCTVSAGSDGANAKSAEPEYNCASITTLLPSSADIEHDPTVINHLRDLVSHLSTASTLLSVASWRVLLSRIRVMRYQARFRLLEEELQGEAAHNTPRNIGLVSTMGKLARVRELELSKAVRERETFQKEARKTQAHLVHSVATVLLNVDRSDRQNDQSNEVFRLIYASGDGSRSPQRDRRSLYPTTRVNLSEIPSTQQLSTPSFPVNDPQVPSPHETRPRSSPVSSRPFNNARLNLSLDSDIENNNQFPQRDLRFVSVINGEDLTLTHSYSGIISSTQPRCSPRSRGAMFADSERSAAPMKMQSKISTTATHDRSVHSASVLRSWMQRINEVGILTEGNQDLPVLPQAVDSNLIIPHRPSRPQSSPAGLSVSQRYPERSPSHEIVASDVATSFTKRG